MMLNFQYKIPVKVTKDQVCNDAISIHKYNRQYTYVESIIVASHNETFTLCCSTIRSCHFLKKAVLNQAVN